MWARAAILVTLLAGYILLSCQQISLRTSGDDLGRHIRDGELILAGKSAEILHHNFYSYAAPESPFVNHHWLTSILFYSAWKAGGFELLNLAYVLLGFIALFFYYRLAEREAGLATAGAISALLLPLLSVRAGVRPEIFTTLMLAAFLTILWRCYRGDWNPAWLWALPVLEILWVNLHPGFVIGPIVVACFLMGAPALRMKLAPVLAACILMGVANPNGINGLLFPIRVQQNYGFSVRENLSVFSLTELWMSKLILATAVLVAACFWIASKRGKGIAWPLAIFSFGVIAVTLRFYREYVILGPVALLAICATTRLSKQMLIAVCAIAIVSFAVYAAPLWDSFGLGQQYNDEYLAQFLKDNAIRGRMFNDYSTGGYLIYYFPGEKIFVDSRPEAYPPEFLETNYTLPLKDEAAWNATLRKYDFDFICFGRLNSEDGQFIVRRIHDAEWALVSGGSDVVLVRRKPQFAGLIARKEIKVQ